MSSPAFLGFLWVLILDQVLCTQDLLKTTPSALPRMRKLRLRDASQLSTGRSGFRRSWLGSRAQLCYHSLRSASHRLPGFVLLYSFTKTSHGLWETRICGSETARRVKREAFLWPGVRLARPDTGPGSPGRISPMGMGMRWGGDGFPGERGGENRARWGLNHRPAALETSCSS